MSKVPGVIPVVLAVVLGGGAAKGETTAIVKPIKPETLQVSADVQRAVGQVVIDLGKEVDLLPKRQSDVATCYEAAKTAPQGQDDGSYLGCLAEAAGATRGSWSNVAQVFTKFDAEMGQIQNRIGEAREAVREFARQKDNEEASLKAGIASGMSRLRQLQAALQKGGSLTPEQEDGAYRLLDDIRTVKARAEIVARSHASVSRSLTALDAYEAQIAEARRSASLLTHQAQNRADFWGTVLEDLRGRAPVVMIAGQIRGSFKDLSPIIIKLHSLTAIALPPEAQIGEPEKTPPTPILPRRPIVDEINSVLEGK